MIRSIGIALLFAATTVAGCASDAPSQLLAEDTTELQVSFSWADTARCSKFSPAITVEGIPPQTSSLLVTLVDLNDSTTDHGGGDLLYAQSNVIPAGALQNNYSGPCPMLPHMYEFTVRALDERGIALAIGKARQLYR